MPFLMHPDGAVAAVIDNQDDRVETRLKRGAEFCAIHLEITVTGEAENEA